MQALREARCARRLVEENKDLSAGCAEEPSERRPAARGLVTEQRCRPTRGIDEVRGFRSRSYAGRDEGARGEEQPGVAQLHGRSGPLLDAQAAPAQCHGGGQVREEAHEAALGQASGTVRDVPLEQLADRRPVRRDQHRPDDLEQLGEARRSSSRAEDARRLLIDLAAVEGALDLQTRARRGSSPDRLELVLDVSARD